MNTKIYYQVGYHLGHTSYYCKEPNTLSYPYCIIISNNLKINRKFYYYRIYTVNRLIWLNGIKKI